MLFQKLCIAAVLFVAHSFVSTTTARAIGLGLGKTKEELKLDYDVSVYDHKTGRVTITFTLKDAGRLTPLTSVDFYIPSEEKHADGQGYKSDLSLSMEMKEEVGKQVARIHLKKEFAERGQIWLKTGTLDGKQSPLTWYYYPIPLKEFLGEGEKAMK